MKTTACIRQKYTPDQPLPFPNAATRHQLFGKLLDLALIAVCGMGMAAAVLLLLVIA
ncbi:MAG: hypothetical protein IJO04_05285 [Oscillospiraceae bacterium]|nr:hypothetical protein [Oscillospiraceae bacterium]